MSRLIHSLESRTLFSATSAQAAILLGDVRQVTASAAMVRADLRLAVSVATTGTNKVAADLRTTTNAANRAANAALLRALTASRLSTFARLRVDQAAFLAVGAGLSARAAADARALLLHPASATIQARVATDITALATQPAARLATFQADAQGNLIGAALTSLVDANPSNTALAADASGFQAGGAAAAAIGNVITAAGSFTATITTLSVDVNSTASGSNFPNLVGTYVGQVTNGTHNQGLPSTWTLAITAEGADGSFSGTITTTQNGNTTSQTAPITGSVAADGAFTLTAAIGGVTGTVSATTLSGTFDDGSGGTGPVTLTKQ